VLVPFSRFVEGIFPSISPERRRALFEAARKYPDIPASVFATELPAKVMQGDVLGPLLFEIESERSGLFSVRVPGLMLSHSCDFDADPFVTFVPCYEYKKYAHLTNASSIRANEVTGLFFLPPVRNREALVADFRTPSALRTATVRSSLERGECTRICSFTEIGWYLFITKLTLHFLRPQLDEKRGIAQPELRERLLYALWQLIALGGYVVNG
jgi:hypothetical protein